MTDLAARLERLKPALACPTCRGGLSFAAESLTCEGCRAVYPIRCGKVYFTSVPERTDTFDDVKERLRKRLGKYYYTIGKDLIAPVYPFRFMHHVRRFVDPAQRLVVDVGCGNHKIDPDVIGLDISDYDAVDIVCDVTTLPFKPGSVDAFLTRGVLEHVPDAFGAVRSFQGATKAGGVSIHVVPFLFPFHASPHDYIRFTHKGLEELFRGWEIAELRNAGGPVTLWLLMTIEVLSIVFSLGHEKLRAHAYLAFCLLLFPLKYFDFPFDNRPSFLALAPTIFVAARKPSLVEGTP